MGIDEGNTGTVGSAGGSSSLASAVPATPAKYGAFDQQRQDLHLTLMVCGESGIGKSTAIRTLFQIRDRNAGSGKTEAITGISGSSEKTKNITELKGIIESPDGMFRLIATVVDTPGWGDHEHVREDLDGFTREIERRTFAHYESVRKTGGDPTDDGRIDVLLYFLAPHRVKELDVFLLKELSKKTLVVPVISKADALTEQELAEQKSAVGKLMETKGIQTVSEQLKCNPDSETLKDVFAVISSDDERGERVYPWGTARIWDEKHSDTKSLKDLLVNKEFGRVKKSTKHRYEEWVKDLKAEKEQRKRNKRRNAMMVLLLACCVSAALALVAAGLSGFNVLPRNRPLLHTAKDALEEGHALVNSGNIGAAFRSYHEALDRFVKVHDTENENCAEEIEDLLSIIDENKEKASKADMKMAKRFAQEHYTTRARKIRQTLEDQRIAERERLEAARKQAEKEAAERKALEEEKRKAEIAARLAKTQAEKQKAKVEKERLAKAHEAERIKRCAGKWWWQSCK